MTNITNYDLRELINKQDWNTIKTHQATWSTQKFVGMMQELPQAQKVILFRLLEKNRAIEVFERLDIVEGEKRGCNFLIRQAQGQGVMFQSPEGEKRGCNLWVLVLARNQPAFQSPEGEKRGCNHQHNTFNRLA